MERIADICTCDNVDITQALICPKHRRGARQGLARLHTTLVAINELPVEAAPCLCGPESDLWEISEMCPRHREIATEALDQLDAITLREESAGLARLLDQIRSLPEAER